MNLFLFLLQYHSFLWMTIIHFKGALFQIGANRKDFLFSFKAKDKNVMLYKYNSIPDNKNNVDRDIPPLK
jgi:hypothetical protein